MSEAPFDRRKFVTRGVTLAGAALLSSSADAAAGSRLRLDDVTGASATELQTRMDHGTLSSETLTQRCLARIAELDRKGPAVQALLELNPQALEIAAERDRERKAGRVRGPLHGMPILVKDNIDTHDRMKTSAGSLALAANTAPRDAFIIERLRSAGAVLLGKTNLSEWANFRSTHSTSGWSARGGLTKNPHVLDRNTSGSSSGTAAALCAGFAPLGIGTETDGSILSPSAVCGIVGIKPTVGLWSRSGIVPIALSQDTAGPMARSVEDAALLLGALAGVDPRDPATAPSDGKGEGDYTRYLDENGLVGARIGVPRNLAGFHPEVDHCLEHAIDVLKQAGAVLIDGLSLPTAGKFDDAELEVLLYEFKAGIDAYLATLAGHPPRTLTELIAFNQREHSRELGWFGQELFERAAQKGPLTDAAYRTARAHCLEHTRSHGLDPLFQEHELAALICPTNPPAWTSDLLNGDHLIGGNTSFAAVAGYPSLTVPMGATRGLPLGLSFIGPAWSEAQLIKLAYGFEQRTKARLEPRFLPTLDVRG
jgi:amidase